LDIAIELRPERFAQGLTIEQYINGMQKNRDTFRENYESFTLEPEDEAFFRDLGRDLNVMVLAEDWCGDVLRYLPVFVRMAEAAQRWNVRIFYRDVNLDLADACLKQGKYRAIPVFKFYDQQMNEVTCFIEKPASVYTTEDRAREAFAAEHLDLPDAGKHISEMSEQTYNLYVDFIRTFRAENRNRWQQLFVDEIKNKLSVAGGSTNNRGSGLSQPRRS
jgi:hypothetical protein